MERNLGRAHEIAEKASNLLKGNTILDILDVSGASGCGLGIVYSTPGGVIRHLTIPGGKYNIGLVFAPIIFKKVESVSFEQHQLYGKTLTCKLRVIVDDFQLVIEYDINDDRMINLTEYSDHYDWSGGINRNNISEFVKCIIYNYCTRNNESVETAERKFLSSTFRPEQLGNTLDGVLIYMEKYSTYKNDVGTTIITVPLKTLQGNDILLSIIVGR